MDGRTVGLGVGNSAYQRISPLRNPVNGANLVADTLRRLGFDLLGGETDPTEQKLKSATYTQEFRAALLPNSHSVAFPDVPRPRPRRDRALRARGEGRAIAALVITRDVM